MVVCQGLKGLHILYDFLPLAHPSVPCLVLFIIHSADSAELSFEILPLNK